MNQHSIGLTAKTPKGSNIDRLTLNISTRALTIYYSKYTYPKRTKEDLLNFLLKFELIHSEHKNNQLRLHNSLYGFSEHHENILAYAGKVTLLYLGEYANKNPSLFLSQFVNIN